MGSCIRVIALVGSMTAMPLVAWAQAQPQPDAPPPAKTDSPAPSAEPEPVNHEVSGATYSDHGPGPSVITDTPRPTRAPRMATRAFKPQAVSADAPIATLDGFEMLPDGGSRVYVDVSKSVSVEEIHGQDEVRYTLKGAHVLRRNNTNPLVTVHWNTPVASARLVPSGNDLQFVVALRATSTPSWKLVPNKDGGSRLQVDFPSGNFVAPTAVAEADEQAGDDPNAESAVSHSAPSPALAAAPAPRAKKAHMQRLTKPPPPSSPSASTAP